MKEPNDLSEFAKLPIGGKLIMLAPVIIIVIGLIYVIYLFCSGGY